MKDLFFRNFIFKRVIVLVIVTYLITTAIFFYLTFLLQGRASFAIPFVTKCCQDVKQRFNNLFVTFSYIFHNLLIIH